tara:strand:+ start:55 stop:549 length:495 start_codon:yes stop_codon:yes gene_type:complete
VTYFTTFLSPIGELTLTGNDASLTGLYFSIGPKARSADPSWERDDQRFAEAVAQLDAYFAGRLRAFDLRLKPRATPFQAQVLGALQEIPYGESRSYKDIAQAIGNPKAVRAVGAANGANPIAIIIPCHRVVGSNGGLTGFGGGLPGKRYLLDLETRTAGFRLSN